MIIRVALYKLINIRRSPWSEEAFDLTANWTTAMSAMLSEMVPSWALDGTHIGRIGS